MKGRAPTHMSPGVLLTPERPFISLAGFEVIDTCHCTFGVVLAGFEVVDALAREAGIDCRKLEKSAAVGKGEVCGKQVSTLARAVFVRGREAGTSVQSWAVSR